MLKQKKKIQRFFFFFFFLFLRYHRKWYPTLKARNLRQHILNVRKSKHKVNCNNKVADQWLKKKKNQMHFQCKQEVLRLPN